jgi:hypothetical protein
MALNKPDWKDAPEWAEWLAQNWNGQWYFHQYKPESSDAGVWHSTGLMSFQPQEGWENSLEKRPNE